MNVTPDTTKDITGLIREHQPLVQRALRRFGVPERDLPDATQDVFVVVHRKLATFEGRSQLSSWIYRIAFHVASERRRRACNRHEVLLEQALIDVECPSSTTFDPERRQRLDHVTRAVDALDPNQRDVWLDFELEEQPMATIAARLKIPLKTAFSRLYAARRDLTRRLRDSGLALLFPRPSRSWPSLTWITSVAVVVLLVPELHHVNVQAPSTTSPTATQQINATTFTPSTDPISFTQPMPSTPRVRITRKTRGVVAPQPSRGLTPSSKTESEDADDLIVFHDGETVLAPSLPPPLLAELPPAAAREPRIQLRGQRDTAWKLLTRP